MKKQEMMTACLKQMIFDDFLKKYHDAIDVLLKNQGFLFEIKCARGNTPEEIEFCADNKNLNLQKFKNRLSEHFYESKAYFDYPEFRYITDDVKARGLAARGKPYAAKSAYISIYYAIRFYQINRLDIE